MLRQFSRKLFFPSVEPMRVLRDGQIFSCLRPTALFAGPTNLTYIEKRKVFHRDIVFWKTVPSDSLSVTPFIRPLDHTPKIARNIQTTGFYKRIAREYLDRISLFRVAGGPNSLCQPMRIVRSTVPLKRVDWVIPVFHVERIARKNIVGEKTIPR